MKFDSPLESGRLIRRYKRFLVDVELDSGEVITAHTPNTGAMIGCNSPGAKVWLSHSDNPKRKYAKTLELIESDTGVPVGVHTLRSNRLAEEAILAGFGELGVVSSVQREVRYGTQNSRIDLLLGYEDHSRCFVEVKNLTLAENGTGYFPDAVTARGTKHLQELMHVVEGGDDAVIFFCVQREDVEQVKAARHIDPVYADALVLAVEAGVKAVACRFEVSASGIVPQTTLDVIIES